ncbi:toll/interleukin-1 receptor domain-containing protein [Stratiformator vulcanicus]|uniref:TIR domain-containing protein n=1 Tax=Stratiformator vulcanicus TaxID=2527980 RepID=A0A517QWD2_9PLAN|nr:toll/interleukin-1 receptor domain-containing protein [Stratiformator vulcanicus]QDT35966.1 hypothetical protein Pan189_03210 [Stratiformator vulcanicus]
MFNQPSHTSDSRRTARRFGAFISYSRRDNSSRNRNWADWLQDYLEHYQIPSSLIKSDGRRSFFPVFVDHDELAVAHRLTDSLKDKLSKSDALVVLCSPRSAVSPHVNREITEFRELKSADRIFCVIIDGDPSTREPGVTCFPPALFENTEDPPLAADFRPSGLPNQGFTSSAALRRRLIAEGKGRADIQEQTRNYAKRLRVERLRLLAGLLKVEYGLFVRKHNLAERRRFLLKSVAMIAIAGLSVFGLVLYVATRPSVARYRLKHIHGAEIDGDTNILRITFPSAAAIDLYGNVESVVSLATQAGTTTHLVIQGGEGLHLEPIAKLESLERLILRGCKNLPSLQFINRLSRLKELSLTSTELYPARLRDIERNDTIEILHLGGNRAIKSEDAVYTLRTMRSLTTLNLPACEQLVIDLEVVAAFDSTEALQSLNLSGIDWPRSTPNAVEALINSAATKNVDLIGLPSEDNEGELTGTEPESSRPLLKRRENEDAAEVCALGDRLLHW